MVYLLIPEEDLPAAAAEAATETEESEAAGGVESKAVAVGLPQQKVSTAAFFQRFGLEEFDQSLSSVRLRNTFSHFLSQSTGGKPYEVLVREKAGWAEFLQYEPKGFPKEAFDKERLRRAFALSTSSMGGGGGGATEQSSDAASAGSKRQTPPPGGYVSALPVSLKRKRDGGTVAAAGSGTPAFYGASTATAAASYTATSLGAPHGPAAVLPPTSAAASSAAASSSAATWGKAKPVHKPSKSVVDRLAKLSWGRKWKNPFLAVITRESAPALGCPAYFTVVQDPMNLTWMKQKVTGKTPPAATRVAQEPYRHLLKQYTSLEEVEADCRLLVRNAHAYNRPGDDVYGFASELFQVLQSECLKHGHQVADL